MCLFMNKISQSTLLKLILVIFLSKDESHPRSTLHEAKFMIREDWLRPPREHPGGGGGGSSQPQPPVGSALITVANFRTLCVFSTLVPPPFLPISQSMFIFAVLLHS